MYHCGWWRHTRYSRHRRHQYYRSNDAYFRFHSLEKKTFTLIRVNDDRIPNCSRPYVSMVTTAGAGGSELFLATQTVNQPRYWRGFVQCCGPVRRGCFPWASGGFWLAGWLRLASTYALRMRSAASHAINSGFFSGNSRETHKSIYREHEVGSFFDVNTRPVIGWATLACSPDLIQSVVTICSVTGVDLLYFSFFG